MRFEAAKFNLKGSALVVFVAQPCCGGWIFLLGCLTARLHYVSGVFEGSVWEAMHVATCFLSVPALR